jgi:hypothetical protein
MRVRVAPGWDITHLTDRVVVLRKEDLLYRRWTGQDGFVIQRVDPEMTRDEAITLAVQMAERNDAELGLKVAATLMPSQVALGRLRRRQRQLAHVFGVPGQEPSEKRYAP